MESSLPRALHVVQSLAAENGGTSISVPGLANATAGTGRYRNTVLHFGPEGIAVSSQGSGTSIMQRSCRSTRLLFPTRARAFLGQAVHQVDVVQVHGIWTGHSLAALDFASKFGKPVIVSAHGMLDDWALNHKKWKKLIYSALVERPSLARATCFRALTRVEAENYRAFGMKAPIAVVPNGMDGPDQVSPSEFLERYPHLKGKQIVLFPGKTPQEEGSRSTGESLERGLLKASRCGACDRWTG